jgi:hypothetical protein
MKRIVLLACVALVVASAVPTVAQAFPYLSGGEAAQQVGVRLHSEWNNIRRGSLRASCPALPGKPNLRRCYYSYRTTSGARWCGSMAVREMWDRYYTRFLTDYRC